jgi:putative CocE/NonD family hydrolase
MSRLIQQVLIGCVLGAASWQARSAAPTPAADPEAQAVARAHERTSLAAIRWGVPPEFNRERPATLEPAWSKRLTGYLPARDGTALRFSVLLPAGPGPFPVIINYSGYDPGAIGGASYLHDNSAMSASVDRSLLERGYAVLGVNARGTGCSEGTFDFLGPTYGTDGADIVEWAAGQHWSTGAIGMANWSWAGMSQIATAVERPAHLKAIAPGMALTDPRLDSWAIGGVPSQGFLTGWWMFLHSRWLAVRASAEAEHDKRCLLQVERNYATGETPAVNLPSQLIRHPLHDDWLDQRQILGRADRIAVPVLSMEAFQDEATTARAGYYQERLDPNQLWYLQTNGNHDLYESLEFRPILLDFLDHFVKGLANGFETRPHVEVWQETTSTPGTAGHAKDEQARPTWRIQREHYPIDVEVHTLVLGAGHSLAFEAPADTNAPAGAADVYEYPVPGPAVDLDTNLPAWGPLSVNWQRGSVAYTTATLKTGFVLYGPVSADLWVSSSVSDTDLQVTLTEIRPDGRERFVQRGWLRLSSRELDPTRSTTTRPWPCDSAACIHSMSPGTPVLGRVELTKVSYAFRAGSRLRIWIETPSAQGENSFDHSSLPSTNAIWHDAAHVSKLVYGVIPGATIPPAASCERVLMQPCRPDPLGHVPIAKRAIESAGHHSLEPQ